MDGDRDVVDAVAAAIGAGHTPRAFARVLGERLASRGAVEVVVWSAGADGNPESVVARRRGDAWDVTTGEGVASRAPVREPSVERRGSGQRLILPHRGEIALSIGFARGAAALVDDADHLRTLAQLASVALENQRLIQRVADLSRKAHVENRELRENLAWLSPATSLVARSPAMHAVVERIALVARHDTTVLIQGESGTGKEVVSREIHRRSRRARRPFLQVNCGAIPPGLVDSELFGHEQGAFTGATRRHRGLFESCHGGTLLLDEVGELPAAAQVKLLRVLQERRIRRVGGDVEIDVDVRVVAATNRSLERMVASGEFREDLYYRLDVFRIDVPPLRARRPDLALLAADILRELAARMSMKPPPVTRDLVDRLARHSWPGNVRELANVLEAALVLGGGRTLELPRFRRDRNHAPGARAASRTLADHTRDAIESALTATSGKIYGADGAAARLGLKPATLQSKMVKLGIARNRFLAR